MKQKAFKIRPSTLFIYKQEKSKIQKFETDTTTVVTTTLGTTAFNR